MWLDKMMMTDWITTVATAVSAVAACITAGAVLQQMKINQQQLDLELYERRLRVFNEVKDIIGKTGGPLDCSTQVKRTQLDKGIQSFITSVRSDATFLFDPEILEYIDRIHWSARYRWETTFLGDEKTIVIYGSPSKKIDEINMNTAERLDKELGRKTEDPAGEVKWLEDQRGDGINFPKVEKVFGKYLNLNRKFGPSKRKTCSVTRCIRAISNKVIPKK